MNLLLAVGFSATLLFRPASSAADAYSGGNQTNLSPIPLRLPVPPFHSGPRRIDADPHTESPPQLPRPPFLAPIGTTNLAFHQKVTSSDTNCGTTALARITDGDKEEDETSMVMLHTGKQWVQIDLEGLCSVYAVVIWHREYRDRVFHCIAVQTAEDAAFTRNVHTLFNNDYANLLGLGTGSDQQYCETHEGKLIDAKGVKARLRSLLQQGQHR